MPNPSIDDIKHPVRALALKIIEEAIEPVLNINIEGTRYYNLEDKITYLIQEGITASYETKLRK